MTRTTAQHRSNTEPATPVFLRLPAVMRLTGLGRSTIYRMVADGSFPRPFQLAPRAVAWRRVDIDGWSADRPSAGTARRTIVEAATPLAG